VQEELKEVHQECVCFFHSYGIQIISRLAFGSVSLIHDSPNVAVVGDVYSCASTVLTPSANMISSHFFP